MFSLIITIISIALVAALAVATIYYGGSAFTEGSVKAQASTFINAGQQVAGAVSVYQNAGEAAPLTTITQLTAGGKYLQGEPAINKAWSKLEVGVITDSTADTPVIYSVGPTVESDICKKIQYQAVNEETTVSSEAVTRQTYGCFKAKIGDVETAARESVESDDVDVFFFKIGPSTFF